MSEARTDRRNLDLATALEETRTRYRQENPASGEAFVRACDAMPGGNTRTILFYEPFPLTLPRAEGAHVTGSGRRAAGNRGVSGAKVRQSPRSVRAASLSTLRRCRSRWGKGISMPASLSFA